MAIRDVLRMGDPRLLRQAEPVADLRDPALRELLADMRDTMRSLDGAGLAAPQIGVPLQVVIFGLEHNPRYPDAAPVLYSFTASPQSLCALALIKAATSLWTSQHKRCRSA